MSFETVLYVSVVSLLIFAAFIYWQVVSPRKKARLAREMAMEAFRIERARIVALPKLHTQWLMQYPGKIENPTKRSYGTRYNRMFIVDDQGNAWVGLAISEVLKSLRAGEYIWVDYYIPFCGGGEAFHGEPVEVDGHTIDIYPKWMRAGVNLNDWQLWARIERKFERSWGQGTYHTGLRELNEHMKEIRDKRSKFFSLARAAGVQAE